MAKSAKSILQLGLSLRVLVFIKQIQYQRAQQVFLQAHQHRRQHLRPLATNPRGVGAYLTLFLRRDDFVQCSLRDQFHPK